VTKFSLVGGEKKGGKQNTLEKLNKGKPFLSSGLESHCLCLSTEDKHLIEKLDERNPGKEEGAIEKNGQGPGREGRTPIDRWWETRCFLRISKREEISC